MRMTSKASIVNATQINTTLLLMKEKKKRCRNGVPKITQTRKDKTDRNIQSLIHPYIFSQKSKDVGIGLCIFTRNEFCFVET